MVRRPRRWSQFNSPVKWIVNSGRAALRAAIDTMGAGGAGSHLAPISTRRNQAAQRR
jgi:hypothetical protein